ncbi:His Kinase A (phospho-acceptor) domain-containing protein [Mucilaginibacter sp. OK268]|uniref:ATP-binding protein n=1 Tax=Mucilaginibacter sp. OK268 TaxID=1881048 RepID=UPI0008919C48|nr:ATP-binding protein [Mucilaginibacter sp. OK268]SDP77630.1 His Kinase A (phospho-acceptor) domain-containing protein [Mucilaginibacter sp. OK268]
MAGFAALITFILCTQLRKNLKRDGVNSPWSQYLLYAMCTAVALMAMSFNFDSRWIFQLLTFGLAAGVVALPYTVEEFKSSRSLVNAVIPIVAVGFLTFICEHLFPKLYESLDNVMESAIWFAVIWFCAMWFINRRQSKALEIERTKRRNEEEQNRMMAAMKVNLESQVKERTAELTQQKEELQQALAELKSTQAQLVQQEKMASLGELTAGIAHEIQNPLNFVNNFSEVSIELLDELKVDILSKLPDETKEDVDDIINDLTQNLSKINQHGKRADAIVKGMLQHSRASTSKKEPTDINALADEYLRLSYHGLRAKDKSFNAGMRTSFDETIGNVDAMAQDLGRVLLNLYNNSFYSVAEKKKLKGESYEPMVNVATKHVTLANGHNAVEITVSDNGMGIPQKVLDKIYQPFFTTKPTGQGTGLGLSMSYDIITKAHNGELKVDTAEGEYAKFTITIPTNG